MSQIRKGFLFSGDIFERDNADNSPGVSTDFAEISRTHQRFRFGAPLAYKITRICLVP
jgi:hypothetical protein